MRITAKRYRGKEGFLISGKDRRGRKVSIFTATKFSAERIREKKRAGLTITIEDFS